MCTKFPFPCLEPFRRVYTSVYYYTRALRLVEFVTLVLYIIKCIPHVHSCDAHEKLQKIGTKNSF